MARSRASAEKTLLCAVKFWGVQAGTSTLRKGPRMVTRKQGFSAAEVSKAERSLISKGLLERGGQRSGSTLKLTSKGLREARCASVKLSPWTDDGYPGASLSGRRRRKKGLRGGSCGCSG